MPFQYNPPDIIKNLLINNENIYVRLVRKLPKNTIRTQTETNLCAAYYYRAFGRNPKIFAKMVTKHLHQSRLFPKNIGESLKNVPPDYLVERLGQQCSSKFLDARKISHLVWVMLVLPITFLPCRINPITYELRICRVTAPLLFSICSTLT